MDGKRNTSSFIIGMSPGSTAVLEGSSGIWGQGVDLCLVSEDMLAETKSESVIIVYGYNHALVTFKTTVMQSYMGLSMGLQKMQLVLNTLVWLIIGTQWIEPTIWLRWELHWLPIPF